MKKMYCSCCVEFVRLNTRKLYVCCGCVCAIQNEISRFPCSRYYPGSSMSNQFRVKGAYWLIVRLFTRLTIMSGLPSVAATIDRKKAISMYIIIYMSEQLLVQEDTPINICMHPRFTSDGIKAYVMEELSEYTKPIYANDYQNYIDESKSIYEGVRNIRDGMLHRLRGNLRILVCVCIYNEPSQAVELTMTGIHQNLPHLKRELNIDQNQIAVVMVQDGILNCSPSVIKLYEQFDRLKNKSTLRERIQIIRQEMENAKRQGKQKRMQANDNFPQTIPKRVSLLYQNRWRPRKCERELEMYHLNMLSCFKHLNGKKLSSHAWFFQGFCRYLDPQFCVLLDVGTVPKQKGVCNLIKGMMYDKNIGGVSGFMSIDSEFPSLQDGDNEEEEPETIVDVMNLPSSNGLISEQQINQKRKDKAKSDIPKQFLLAEKPAIKKPKQKKEQPSCFSECIRNVFYSVERAQEVEYIYAHFLDKNFESFTGFLHVLPGAWSGYRLSALQTNQKFTPDILQRKYFKTIINPNLEEGEDAYKQANMYLAQDRILSLAIYCQPRRKFYLKYIPNAEACTDPMKSHFNLVTQRRRWINSSLFAFQYVLANYSFDMRQSNHGTIDYILMNIGMFIAATSAVNAYFIPSFYLFVLYAILRDNETLKSVGLPTGQYLQQYVALFFSLAYVSTVIVAVIGSLNGMRWIKSIYERDKNGDIEMDQKGNPIKKKNDDPDVNGPAVYISIILTFFTYFLMILIGQVVIRTIYQFFNDPQNRRTEVWAVLILMFSNIGMQAVILIMHLTHPKYLLKYILGLLSYTSYQGAYTHTMVIYGFCNVDDVSWGTKGATDTSGQKKFATQKMYFVSSWLFWNTMLCFILFFLRYIVAKKQGQMKDGISILLVLGVYSTITFFIRTLFALLNHVKFYLCCCCGKGGCTSSPDKYQDVRKSRRVSNTPSKKPLIQMATR